MRSSLALAGHGTARLATSLDEQLRAAHAAYQEGRYAAVVQACHAVHAAAPQRTDCLLLLGAAYFHLQAFEACVRANAAALRLDAGIAEAHANLANALQQLGHLRAAAAYYQAALRLRPTFTDACNNLASVYAQQGLLSRAVQCYSDALSLDPCYAPAWRGLGDVLRESGRLRDALPCYVQAVAARPECVAALTGLGLALRKLGRVVEAEAAFKRVLRVQPGSALGLSNLAELYYDQVSLWCGVCCMHSKTAAVANPSPRRGSSRRAWRRTGVRSPCSLTSLRRTTTAAMRCAS